MATKFYLHNANSTVSGTLPSTEQSSLTADSNFFTGVTDADNKSMDTTKGVSQANLTNTSTGDTASHNYYIMKWVSPLIYESQITAQTWTLEYGAKEANAQANFPVSGTSVAGRVNCYVWKPSNGTKVGTILDGNTNADCEEAGTGQSVINTTFAGSAVTGMVAGDAVLVIELWAVVTQASTTARQQDIYYDGTTEASTSNIAAYLSTPQNIELTPTDGAETIMAVGGSISSTANTTEYWSLVGRPTNSATETDVQLTMRVAGTIEKLSIYLGGNTVASGTTTFTVRKNAADTALVASTSTSGAQLIEDLADSVSVAAGDKICLKTVPGAATGTFSIDCISLNFKTTDSYSCQVLGVARIVSITSSGVNTFLPLNGDSTSDTTEAEAKVRQKKAGRYQYMAVVITANARTTSTTFRTRKNGANGNISITVAAGATGIFENTTGVDTVAVDDDYNFGLNMGASSENLTYTVVSIHFFADDQSGFFETGNLNTNTLAANLTRYMIVGGSTNFFTNESDTKRRIRATRITVVGIQCYLVQNTVSATSTLTLRKNGVNCNNTISITSNTAGFFQDNAHTDEFYSGDDIDLQIVNGATGTLLEFSQITIFYKVPRVTLPRVYKYNMLQRVSEPSLLFDGTDDYLACGNDSSLWSQALTKFTIAFWYYPLVTPTADKWVISHGGATSQGIRIVHGGTGDNRFWTNIKNAAGSNIGADAAGSYTGPGKWYHITGVYDSTLGSANLKTYVNATLGGPTGNLTETINLSAAMELCTSTSSATPNGLIKDFRWWTNTALNSTQITDVYNNSSSAPTPNYWLKCKEGTGNPVDSIASKTTTLQNGATWFGYSPAAFMGNPKTYKYNIIGRISLSRIYKYHVLARTSLSRIYKYHLLHRIGGKSTVHDGSGDYIDCGNHATLWSQSLTKFSLSFWFRPKVEQYYELFTHGSGSGRFVVGVNFTDMFFKIDFGAGDIQAFGGIGSGIKWHHAIATFDSTLGSNRMKIYLDGNTTPLAQANGSGSAINLSAIVRLGDSLNGNLRDVRFWSSIALTTTNVTDVYNDSASAPTPDYWLRMDEMTGTPVDSIGGKTTTFAGNTAWDTIPAPQASNPKRYKYNILGRISLSRIYKYHVQQRISLSQIYKYNILGTLTRISKTQIYKYHVLGRISLSRIYKYHVQQRISLSRIYKYHVIGRISLSRIYKYHVQKRVSLSRIYKYHIQARVSLLRTYKYHILARVSLQRVYKYHILARISLTRIYKYHVQKRVSLIRIYKYHVAVRVSLSRVYKYHVLSRVSLSRIYKYHVAIRVSLIRVYKYHVIGRISLQRIYKYHVQARVSLQRVYKYNVLSRVSLPRIYKYNVLIRTSLPRIYKYHIANRISLSRIYKYHVLQRVSLSRTYLYNVVALGLIRISKAQIYKFNVLERVSISQIYKYHVANLVSLSRVYKYNVQARISLIRTYKHNITQRVSLLRTYKYHILSRVSLSRNYKYNLLQRISLIRNYKYNVLGRISLTRIYRYNILVRVSLTSVYKYNILQRISLSRIYKYNVIAALARVSKTQIYKYNVIARTSLIQVYRYNILNTVSLIRTYKYNIANRVSKQQVYKFNVLQRISSSLKIKYDIVGVAVRIKTAPQIATRFVVKHGRQIPKIGSFMRQLYDRVGDDEINRG